MRFQFSFVFRCLIFLHLNEGLLFVLSACEMGIWFLVSGFGYCLILIRDLGKSVFGLSRGGGGGGLAYTFRV